MMRKDYYSVMTRREQIMKEAVGIDYERYRKTPLVFDYERMMQEVGYSTLEVQKIQKDTGVGNTPLLELKNITKLARVISPPGKGARIFLKDEACNPSGSYKARRASMAVYHAKEKGYKGVIAATSGNYGAAVASLAAKLGLDCIIVQEVFDSRNVGQPEILEKGRKCEAYGAEVIQLTVGPELFYKFLILLEQTEYFNASLYTPFSIAGVETIGIEIKKQVNEETGKDPDAVIVTNAGGGNLTGTARGLLREDCVDTDIIATSVDLTGLHMASDNDFNKKSFTTGHTGFGVPFATRPDRTDVPINAARALRYMDKYVTVTQGDVFYITEALAALEGLERGPAGNTSLASAFHYAQMLDEDQVVVVQETEYTGAGKHPYAQLTFAKENNIDITNGDPKDNVPGEKIVIPKKPEQLKYTEISLDKLKKTYFKNVIKVSGGDYFDENTIEFLAEDTKLTPEQVENFLQNISQESKINN
ncbi:2-amino-4-oxopentanoate thiolase subunit OrtB [Natranaerofaba carboxydovora]|uniref:2-amino-4-oxopentanoate thiolase subunit OrtB n=1 Tax=Natranaerofaba carboxydovora TaxID=2742683 RepID=UPI001F13A439|nr:2-amino-4-oxopentanoate thiolase subunit OrtB [Natranaerofaba carboxydovora]UMZ74825.1 2-amino-4-ketopentanoate thiolase beta subunit [Natranaerofaba carboxydovora]